MRCHSIRAIVVLCVLGYGVRSRFAAADEYTTVVRGYREDDPLRAQRRVERHSPGFATAVAVEHERGARPADALPEIVARTPGATVRSIGGLGQFSSVSLRGSSGQQVPLFLDGVPLGSSLGGLTNLGAIPLDAIGVVEIYRGYVPIELGGAAIGGAINLVGKVYQGPARLYSTVGYGSFGAREGRLAASIPVSKQDSVTLRIGYAGASGAFPFFDTNGTPQFRGDDRETDRINNGYDRVLAQVRGDGEHGRWRYGVQQIVLWRDQGIPGPATAQSEFSALETLSLKTTASVTRRQVLVPGGKIRLLLGFGHQRRHFTDPNNEVGVAFNDELTRTSDVYLSPRLKLPLWRGAALTTTLDARLEWVDVDNRIDIDPLTGLPTGDATRQRFAYGIGLQLRQFFFGSRLAIVPAVRLDALQSRFAVANGQGEQDDEGQDDVTLGVSPRVAIKWRALDWLEVRTSVGRYFRPPTLVELFGDQGFSVGNEGLSAERGTSLDGGVVVDWASDSAFAVHLQAAGFMTWSENLIQWVQAGPVARASNIAGARVSGLELGASAVAWRKRAQLHASYTLINSSNGTPETEQNGKALPGRPQHSLYLRPSFGEQFSLWGTQFRSRLSYTLEYISGTFLDPSGRREVPARILQGIGWEVSAHAVRLAFEVRNLFDVRRTTWTAPVGNAGAVPVPVADFIGYPLPGRSFFLRCTIDHDFGNQRKS